MMNANSSSSSDRAAAVRRASSGVALWHQPNPEDNVGSSKAVGEPPFMLGISVWEAIRDAVAQARTKAWLAGPVKLETGGFRFYPHAPKGQLGQSRAKSNESSR